MRASKESLRQAVAVEITGPHMPVIDTEALVALLSLTAMEIVLGIDNIVFISIIAGRVPVAQRKGIVRTGVLAALGLRVGMLSMLSWLMNLTAPVFTVLGNELSWRDLILLGGGLFLIFKATRELYVKVEGHQEDPLTAPRPGANGLVIAQILAVDLVFSLDSVITAVGMAQALWIMVVAMITAVLTMLLFANAVGGFVERHPSVKVLALAFLLMIGTMLVAEGLGTHVPKGYVYASMTFSLLVEVLNLRRAARSNASQAAKA